MDAQFSLPVRITNSLRVSSLGTGGQVIWPSLTPAHRHRSEDGSRFKVIADPATTSPSICPAYWQRLRVILRENPFVACGDAADHHRSAHRRQHRASSHDWADHRTLLPARRDASEKAGLRSTGSSATSTARSTHWFRSTTTSAWRSRRTSRTACSTSARAIQRQLLSSRQPGFYLQLYRARFSHVPEAKGEIILALL